MSAVFVARPGRALGWGRGDRVNWTVHGLACSECEARHGVTPDGGEWSGRSEVSVQFNGYVNGTLCDRCRRAIECAESQAQDL